MRCATGRWARSPGSSIGWPRRKGDADSRHRDHRRRNRRGQPRRRTCRVASAGAGYHATGRSAAFWDECYGGPQIVPLTQASGPYLAECGVLAPRGALYLAPPGETTAVGDFLAAYAGSGVALHPLNRAQLAARVPGLREGWDEGVWQPACADIDVATLHAHYLARARASGVTLHPNARIDEVTRTAAGWRLVGHGVALDCGTLVNAAGAWADEVARLAGIGQLGITPLRRTMVQLRVDPPPPPDLPLVIGMDGSFYFRPD
ncbi:MAG: hypothetical protein DI636_10360, partial [Pelagerythrobacter marensis]